MSDGLHLQYVILTRTFLIRVSRSSNIQRGDVRSQRFNLSSIFHPSLVQGAGAFASVSGGKQGKPWESHLSQNNMQSLHKHTLTQPGIEPKTFLHSCFPPERTASISEQHSGAVVSTVPLQQEGGRKIPRSGVCMSSGCLCGFSGLLRKTKHRQTGG